MDSFWKLGGAVLGGFLSVFLLAGVTAQQPYKVSAAPQPLEMIMLAENVAASAAEPRMSKEDVAAAERALRRERIEALREAREAMDDRERMAMVHLLRGIQAQRLGH